MSLKKFVELENRIIAFFPRNGETAYNIKSLSAEDKKRLAQRVLSALEPECLTCDGELRGAKLQAKARMLQQAKADLEAMGQVVEWEAYEY
jgi:hypothetical protein